MTEEQEVPTESCDGSSDTFASVWVKVEMCEDVEDTEKVEIKPDIEHLPRYVKPKKKGAPRTVLKCEHCPYTSIYKTSFKQHVMDHLNDTPLSCDMCEYTTKYQTSLQRHMFIKHRIVGEDNKVLLKCDSCDYSTYFKWNLNAHKRRHATNKQFQCAHCTYSTAYRHNFVKHSKVHNKVASEYKCDKCPFVTKFTGHIQRHMSQIHNEVSEKASACDYCDFTTMVRWRLNVHKQRSRQENPLKCGRCSFQTHYMCQIKKHKKSHFNDLLKAVTGNAVIENTGQYNDADEYGDGADLMADGVVKSDMVNGSFNGVNENSGHDDDKMAKGVLNAEAFHGIINGVNENKGQISAGNEYDNTDRMPLGFPKPEMVKGIDNGVNGNMGQVSDVYKHNNVMTKAFLKGEPANMYELVHGVNENRQINYENEYSDSVRMTQGFLRNEAMSLYDIVNEVNQHQGHHANVQRVNDINRTPESVMANHFTELNTTIPANSRTKDTSNATKLKKVKNYLVDPKCETRKTIQVLESDDTERPFQCVKCSYISKFKAAVIRHYQRLHTNKDRPFKCCNCDFSTKTKDQISLHNKRSQSEGTLICNICNFTTNFKCTYVMHQKVHYAHKCTICDYSCRNKYDIQKHFTTVHLGEGMKCRYCDFRSARRESLLCHEAVHTGHKPFKCELCDYQSVRRSLLEVHFRRCHGHAKMINGKIQIFNANK